ncbi:MAG: hypothetical protein J6I60_02570 [Bacteroidaceae bacterium]|nr:hypothetical protein [Bacteroidaceae bacterium]
MKGWEKVPVSVGTEVELSNNFVFDKQGRNDASTPSPPWLQGGRSDMRADAGIHKSSRR